MRQSKSPLSVQRENEALIEQIRANTVFEHLSVAVLAGAGLCGASVLALKLGAGLIAGDSLQSILLGSVFSALTVMLVFFVIGFGVGVAGITPLYRYLESRRRRNGWPYAALSLGVALGALLLARLLPGTDGPGLLIGVAVLAASIATAVMFALRMRPIWAAAAKDEEAKAASAAPITFRLH